MMDDTLPEILSGHHAPESREELHGALDALLDAADADGGRLDGLAFWAFVASVARGRGVAEDLMDSAAHHIAKSGGLPEPDPKDPAGVALAAARMVQWATLASLLRHVTAFPGEIVPRDFQVAWFIATADNIVAGRGEVGKGPHIDLLGLETQRGVEWEAEGRAARRQLLGAVYFRAEQTGQKIAQVRRDMLPDVPDRTWKDWAREVATAKRVPVTQVGEDARAAARLEGNPTPYDLSPADVARLMRTAWRPR